MSHRVVVDDRPNRLAMSRSRGAVSGILLMALGAWGALIPFVGHYFSFGFTPDNTWAWTAARFWLEVLPGAGAFVGGALLVSAGDRLSAVLGGWLAAASGAWFVLGVVFTPLWNAGFIGNPVGGTDRAVVERITMFDGLGVVIVGLAMLAIGRASVVAWRDVAAAAAADQVVDVRSSASEVEPAATRSTTTEPVATEPVRTEPVRTEPGTRRI